MEREDLYGYGAVGAGLGGYAGADKIAAALQGRAEKSIPWKHHQRSPWVSPFVEVWDPETMRGGLGLKEVKEAHGPFLGQGKKPWWGSPEKVGKSASMGMKIGGPLLAALGIYELMGD